MRRAVVSVVVVAALVGSAAPNSLGAADPPNPAVFLLATIATSTGTLVTMGTAFFTAGDGTALTNSHVVHRARSDAAHYQLIALYGREFYSASVVCASNLSVSSTSDGKPAETVPGRDVAQVKVAPSRIAGARKVLRFSGGPEFTEHLGRLPVFPVLPLGSDPFPGELVHVPGYGLIQDRVQLTPWEQWTAHGVVKGLATASDGTPLLTISSMYSPRPGSSGSPVLNGANAVVGMIAWASDVDFSFSAGIAGSALKEPCRP
ncbi:MAG TPA: serine protease [bacterium]|nr:serine protease [bacterium]